MSSKEGTKRLVKSQSGLRYVNLEGGLCSPFQLQEPFWAPDKENAVCTKCMKRFDLLVRRHHCRRCGNIFCKDCCEQKLPLPRMSFVDPVRMCGACCEITKKENEFFDRHLKTLLNGTNFILNPSNSGDVEASFFCRLSSDHQTLVFDGGSSWKHDPLPLTQVLSFKVVGTPTASPGLAQISGAVLTYTDSTNEEKQMNLSVSNVPNRKQSIAWITALQKALKFTSSFESP